MADLVGRIESNELQINVTIVGSGPAGRAGYTPVKGVDYFDGKDGAPGRDGVDGRDGYTPVKGVDYFDGKDGSPGKDGEPGAPGKDGSDGSPGRDGRDGADGRDGVSVTHEWVGTTLKITSASGTTSADLKGKDGYTPVRGTDYWTAADVAEIQSYVDQQLGVIENGTY